MLPSSAEYARHCPLLMPFWPRPTSGQIAMTSRRPDASEFKILEDLYQAELKAFDNSPAAADSLLSTGEYPRNGSLHATQVAALTVVASTLVNYDESIYKR